MLNSREIGLSESTKSFDTHVKYALWPEYVCRTENPQRKPKATVTRQSILSVQFLKNSITIFCFFSYLKNVQNILNFRNIYILT